MTFARRNLLAGLAASVMPVAATAQTLSSIRDPQIATLTLEGKVPLANVLPDTAVALSPELIAAIRAGALEQRVRLEFNRGARLFRIHQMLVPPTVPFPLPQAPVTPDRSVGSAFDIAIEHMHWNEWRSTTDGKYRLGLTSVGRVLSLLQGINPPVNEFGVVQLSFLRDAPHTLLVCSLSFAGEIVAVTTEPRGNIELDAPIVL